MLCSTLERRKNCLHLVVAWPNAVVPDGLYGWNNSCVVQTQNTLDLCRAADLTVSAAGYNSFHELMYAGIPTIFIPQAAPYLDDQERRAQAAADRGLAALVLESELMLLGREVNAFLDGNRVSAIAAAHANLTLPDTGNRAAAACIEQGMT
jgi:UDP-N-acetylglucosamine:LPS N-acetylglucosamine transferase